MSESRESAESASGITAEYGRAEKAHSDACREIEGKRRRSERRARIWRAIATFFRLRSTISRSAFIAINAVALTAAYDAILRVTK